MKSIIGIFVLSFVQFTFAQDQALNCRFLITRVAEQFEYLCMLSRVSIDPTAESYTISGQHESGYTDANVKGVLITDCDVPVLTQTLIEQFYEKFPFIVSFEVFNSQLQKIEPGAFAQSKNSDSTKNFWIVFNNLTTIEDGAFDGLRNLETLRIVSSRVETISDGAFRQLERVKRLYLNYNQITDLPRDVLSAMTKLNHFDASNNQLQIINGDLFYNNSELQYIHIDHNPIIAIGRNFFAGLHVFNLITTSRALCVDGTFLYREVAMRGLAKCFENYEELQNQS